MLQRLALSRCFHCSKQEELDERSSCFGKVLPACDACVLNCISHIEAQFCITALRYGCALPVGVHRREKETHDNSELRKLTTIIVAGSPLYQVHNMNLALQLVAMMLLKLLFASGAASPRSPPTLDCNCSSLPTTEGPMGQCSRRLLKPKAEGPKA